MVTFVINFLVVKIIAHILVFIFQRPWDASSNKKNEV